MGLAQPNISINCLLGSFFVCRVPHCVAGGLSLLMCVVILCIKLVWLVFVSFSPSLRWLSCLIAEGVPTETCLRLSHGLFVILGYITSQRAVIVNDVDRVVFQVVLE